MKSYMKYFLMIGLVSGASAYNPDEKFFGADRNNGVQGQPNFIGDSQRIGFPESDNSSVNPYRKRNYLSPNPYN